MILELTKQNILNLTNESKRKAILAAWRNWGIWHKAPEIGLSVYRQSSAFQSLQQGRQAESREQGREPADGQAQRAEEGDD